MTPASAATGLIPSTSVSKPINSQAGKADTCSLKSTFQTSITGPPATNSSTRFPNFIGKVHIKEAGVRLNPGINLLSKETFKQCFGFIDGQAVIHIVELLQCQLCLFPTSELTQSPIPAPDYDRLVSWLSEPTNWPQVSQGAQALDFCLHNLRVQPKPTHKSDLSVSHF